MEYRGNPSLPAEIQQRIRSTFEQALQSARSGNHREALLGCDFILKLDSEFAPARTLAERLRAALDRASAPASPPPVAAPPAAAAGHLAAQMKDLFAQRRFEEVAGLAAQNQDQVTADPELRQLATRAQERLGVEPFLVKFLGGAQRALLDGQLGEADKLLHQARELDPSDPRLSQLERMLAAQRPTAAPPAPASPPAPVSPPAPASPPPPAVSLGEASPGPFDDPLAGLAEEVDAGWAALDAGTPAADASGGEIGDPLSGLGFDLGDEPAAGPTSPAPDPLSGLGFDTPSPAPQEAGFAFGPSPTESPVAMDDPFADDGSLDAMFDQAFDLDASPAAEVPGPSSQGAMDELDDDLDFSLNDLDAAGSDAGAAELDFGAAPPAQGGDRIGQLLAEGQVAFDQEDYQGAIDVWSRIFLIDIDHQEASRRIEQARSLKAEMERKVEEVFHEALGELEAGRLETARTGFQRVLQLHPGHAVAGEYLQRIDRGSPGGLPEDMPPPMTPTEGLDLGGLSLDQSPLQEEILVPPDPGAAPSPPRPAPAKPSKKTASGPRLRFAMISALSLLLLVVVGWFLVSNWDRFFPNTGTENTATPPAASANPIDQARKLHEKGKTRMALAQLKRIPDNSPFHAQAVALIAELERAESAPAQGQTPASEPEVTSDLAQRRAALIADAGEALAAGRALRARELLRSAADLEPLSPDEAAALAGIEEELAPIKTEISLFEDGEWNEVLPSLWRLHETEPDNPDVKRLLIDSYYNLGVRYLQRNQPVEAAKSFDEVLGLEPDDAEAQRHGQLAQAYKVRPPDLLYRIYVKYLPFR